MGDQQRPDLHVTLQWTLLSRFPWSCCESSSRTYYQIALHLAREKLWKVTNPSRPLIAPPCSLLACLLARLVLALPLLFHLSCSPLGSIPVFHASEEDSDGQTAQRLGPIQCAVSRSNVDVGEGLHLLCVTPGGRCLHIHRRRTAE
jgi:hypothetical protein